MKNKGKLVISLIFTLGLISLGYYLIFVRFACLEPYDITKPKNKMIKDQTEGKINQYAIVYKSSRSMKQTIDLKAGVAKFYILHNGKGNFNVELKTRDQDSLIGVLVKTQGPFEDNIEINIPSDDAYILNVISSGEWTIAKY